MKQVYSSDPNNKQQELLQAVNEAMEQDKKKQQQILIEDGTKAAFGFSNDSEVITKQY